MLTTTAVMLTVIHNMKRSYNNIVAAPDLQRCPIHPPWSSPGDRRPQGRSARHQHRHCRATENPPWHWWCLHRKDYQGASVWAKRWTGAEADSATRHVRQDQVHDCGEAEV